MFRSTRQSLKLIAFELWEQSDGRNLKEMTSGFGTQRYHKMQYLGASFSEVKKKKQVISCKKCLLF